MKGKVESRIRGCVFFFLLCALCVQSAGGCPLLWSYGIDGITALSVSENGDYIVAGCEDGYYYIFDTWGNRVGSGHVPDVVVSLDMADTGEFILGFSNEYTFCTKEGVQLSSVGYNDVRDVSISSDGKFSLACSNKNILVNMGTSMVLELEVSSEYPFGVISSDGTVACAASDADVLVFKISEDTIDTWSYGADEIIKHLFVSIDGKKIIFSAKSEITYIDVEKRESRTVNVGSSVLSLAATPTGDMTLAATDNELFWLDGMSVIEKVDRTGIQFLSLSEDGSIAITGTNNTIQIINRDGTLLSTYDVEGPITALDVSWNKDLLVVCTETSIYTFQLFERIHSNTHVIPLASKKSLPLTSPIEEVWSLPLTSYTYFYTGDVDGDGEPEIVLKEGNTLKIIEGDKTILFEKTFEKYFNLGHVLDIDGDTISEISLILPSTKFRFAVYKWEEDAIEYYYLDELNTGLPLHNAEVAPLAVIDSNTDGNPEILAAIAVGYSCKPRGVASIDYASGKIVWFYQSGAGPMTCAIQDINGDGSLEIITGSMAPCTCPYDEEYPDCDSYVTVLSVKGEELWKAHMGQGFQRITISAEDINENEGIEIIEFGFNASEDWGNISILNCNGEYLYKREFDYSIVPGVTGDIDGDGLKEIVVADTRGYLTVFTANLQEKSKLFVTDDINSMAQVWANDFNGDGFLEIFLILEKGLFIFDKDLNIIFEKEFPEPVWWGMANFSQCKNTLLVASDKLYAFSYETGDLPCPLWEITERELTEKGRTSFEMAESAYASGQYRTARSHYETALDCFSKLEDEEMKIMIPEKITIVSEKIFKEDVKRGIILLGLFDAGLCIGLMYTWLKRMWSRLVEGTFLLSLPLLLGLSQVYFADEGYLNVFITYFVPSLVGAAALILRQNIIGFARTVAAILSGHKNMLVLSLVRSNGSYRVSIESIEERFNPIKESRVVTVPDHKRKDLIKKVEYMMEVLNQVPSENLTLDYVGNVLQETGREIYQIFIPSDFSDILKEKFLLLEVEDTEIPWELMYTDGFFALNYAVSRRIVSPDPVKVRESESEKRKRTRRRALIISDPSENLPAAQTECDIIYKRLTHKMNTILVQGKNANVRRIANLFGQGFDIIHYAGHVDDGFQLSDGVLTSQDVKEFITGTPVVFVNGCRSEELARAFLLGGAAAYVGTIHPVHDKSAAVIASDFYDLCLQHQIGEALRRARLSQIHESIVWTSLVMYGDPTLKLL